MKQIAKSTKPVGTAALRQRSRRRYWKPALAVGMALVLAAVVWVTDWFGGRGGMPADNGSYAALSLLSQAWAAEEALFPTTGGIVHIVNEIVVKPVSDPELAGMRWFPLCSLDAAGELRLHQLSLPAESGEEYTVTDEAWYDAATGRFARVLSVDGEAVFANAYDGTAVYSLAGGADAEREPVGSDFSVPRSPAAFLGIGAGIRGQIGEEGDGLVEAAGGGTLDDGSAVRVLRAGMPGPEGDMQAYTLFRIREDDGTIAEMEFVVAGEPQLLIRRVGTETVAAPGVPWNLAGVTGGTPGPDIAISPDMVVPDVSVQQMIDRADFETYLFASDPPWATEREITDVLDVVSPPHRMFCLTYKAADGRHVVLVQSYSYNRMLGPLVKTGRLVYESPNGFKVWSGPRDQWLAGILLNSARASIKDPAAADCTGYALESPAGTFPCLAVNGQITEQELHALIDSLVPARGYGGN